MKSTRVLLIEDNELQAQPIIHRLAALGYDVAWAATGASGIQIANERAPDCILLDLELPDIDGLAVCRFLATRAVTRDIPIIMLTSRDAVTDKIRGLETGAADYLPKPFDLGELDARIQACVRALSLQREVVVKNRQLEDMLNRFRILASTDELTGLSNRRRFFDELERELSRHQRYGSPLSLVIVDIDHFKTINDSHGHQVGDAVLREVGHRLLNTFRRSDLVARYGGEEFAVLLPETAGAEAFEVAERVRELAASLTFGTDDAPVRLTISGGVAAAVGAADTPEALLRRADAALYRAKANGRDRIELATDDG
jgi:diguanylate cyclase (GGDEF)-like protein